MAKLINSGKMYKVTWKITDPYSASSTPTYSYDKLNENTDITNKKYLTAETRSSTIYDVDDKPNILSQNKPASNPETKYMLL